MPKLALEYERLAILRSLNLWDAIDPPELDRLTRLVAEVFAMPTVLISLVGKDEQRFVSKVGFEPRCTEREVSVCSVAIRQSDLFEVEDLSTDHRFAANRLVLEAPKLRFYAGIPLVTSSGHAIGTLCLIDYVPRQLSSSQRCQLRAFGQLVMDQIALRQTVGRRDAVTGLFNRQQFYADLTALADTLFVGHRYLVLVDVLDLPTAHRLAQALGMGPSEAVIRDVGQRLQSAISVQTDLYHVGVARFAFVVDTLESGDDLPLLNAVAAVVSTPVMAQGIPLQPACHGGIVRFEATDAGDALRKAVTATQDALDAGTLWQFYDEANDLRLRRQYRLAADVGLALARDEFYLVYQPKVQLVDGRVDGAEALLRWCHPELGEVSPGEFIPIVAKTAFMQPLTDWVMDRVCHQQASWKNDGLLVPVSINVAAADFVDGRLLNRVLGPCRQYEIAPSLIELEITEGEWLEGGVRVLAQLADLRQAGVRIAIDDFGVGYSNFSYLYNIPVDTLKLDRALIYGCMDNQRQQAILHGIIRLCGHIGLSVVAEGIETEQEHDALRRFNCELGQGFLYSPGLPADAFERFVCEREAVSPKARFAPRGTASIDLNHLPMDALHGETIDIAQRAPL